MDARELECRFPTDAAPASCSFSLRVVLDRKLRPDQLGNVVDCASPNERQTDTVDQDGHARVHLELAVRIGPQNANVSVVLRARLVRDYLQVVILDFLGDLHLVLVSMASSWLYSHAQCERRAVLALGDLPELRNGTVGSDDAGFTIAVHLWLLGLLRLAY